MSPGSLTFVRVLADSLTMALAGGLAIIIRFYADLLEITEDAPVTARLHWILVFVWVGGLLVAFAAERLYDEDALVVGSGELQRVGRAVLVTAGAFALMIFLSRSFFVSRAWFGVTTVSSLLLLWLDRTWMHRLVAAQRRQGRWRRTAVVVTKDGQVDSDLDVLDEFTVVETVDLVRLQTLLTEGSIPRPGALVVRDEGLDRNQLWQVILDAGRGSLPTYILSPVRSVRRDRLTVREMAGNTLVKVAPPGLHGPRAIQKRVFDVVGACIGLLLTSPLLFVSAIGILVTSGPPILYRQTRLGAAGKRFSIIKFRTMRVDAESAGPVWSERNDARATSVGRLLRRLGIDELPQLWNVLVGDMSLIGPRPERPEFANEFAREIAWYAYRDRIRPGITGWSQAHGLRGDTSLESRVDFDNWYIEHWSLLLDIHILIATLGEIIRGGREPPEQKGG